MGLREAAQQALEALEYSAECGWESHAITDLRAALAEDAVQRLTDEQQEMETTISKRETAEPVAWLQIGVGDHEGTVIATTTEPKTWNPAWWKFKPLYAAPPKREPLTEAELEPIRRRMMMEAYNAADDGDSERYNALKVMANDVLDMLLGGEK